MNPSLPAQLPLVCPACRRRDEAGWHVFTLSLSEVLRRLPDDAVAEGVLRCDNPACGRAYPVIDGVPIVVADLAGVLRSQHAAMVENLGLPLALQRQLALVAQDSDALAAQLEHLSIYLDSHFGDHAEPPPEPLLSGGTFTDALGPALAALVSEVAAGSGPIVELGCSAGRGLWQLADAGASVIGIELRFAALRRARRILAGEPLPYLRRRVARHYQEAVIQAPARPAALVCGDALDPPLVPGSCGAVVALNLLDSVASTPRLLSVIDGLCRPGGQVLLASPYAFQSSVVEEIGLLDEPDPAAALRRLLVDGAGLTARYEILAEDERPWSLRRDARSLVHYQVHVLRARKLGPG